MTWALARKLLRDVWIAWTVVAVLLFLFQILWSRIAQRITDLIGEFANRGFGPAALMNMVMRPGDFPAQMIQSIIGGESIQLDRADNFMSISYVHPLMLTILCVWAIGRAANAIAGEIDRGTMELLLAQPIRRTQLILAHLWVDAIVFPGLCLVIWTGTYCGTWWMGLQTATVEAQHVDPTRFLPALPCVFALLFAVSGMTMFLSALGRSRPRVWGWAITILLAMFLVNVLGQIWAEPLAWVRPFTIHYHYQPQLMILHDDWYADGKAWFHLLTLLGVGITGYLLAWVTFCRRDLPAPL
jgi:ABC-2 type transport system permease protein